MTERELIEYIERLTASRDVPWLETGIGDDAAIIRPPGSGASLAVTTDMAVEGVHYEEETAVELAARKAVARALSDVAAMAARPLCAFAAVLLGAGRDEQTGRRLMGALVEAARQMGAPLVGGDIAVAKDATTCITVTAVGTPGPAGFVLRSGAMFGDAICVTGRLGGSLQGRHLRFSPRINEALHLSQEYDLHALIDISDGLSTDALHLAAASGRGMALRAADIPIAAAASRGEREPLWHALNDGEDYELLFCLSARQAQRAAREGAAGLEVTVIGTVEESEESFLLMPDGSRQTLESGGWEHEL